MSLHNTQFQHRIYHIFSLGPKLPKLTKNGDEPPQLLSRLYNPLPGCLNSFELYLSSEPHHCRCVLVIARLLLLHIGHVLVLGRGPRGLLDVTRGLVILNIDCARVTHSHRVTCLLTQNVLKHTFPMIFKSHLTESEDDVLVVLADVVHAGVVPGRNVMLRNVSIRSVTLVITLT